FNNNFPVEFNETFFTFGSRYYSSEDDGIAFIYPNPFNPQFQVMIFYSNSITGLERLINNESQLNSYDYNIFAGNELVRKGNFNKSGIIWNFDPNLDQNSQRVLPFSDDLS